MTEFADEQDYLPIDPERECSVPVPGGHFLVFPAYPEDCSYVRFVNREGQEVVYWDQNEWRDEPASVMGAIMATILNGPMIVEDA